MSDLYGVLPGFNEGQILTASAHLNALQRYITLAHDDVAGVSTAAYASKTSAIRHQWNSLEYSIYVNVAPVTIKYGTTQVATIVSTGAQSGTVALGSYGLSVDQFYLLTVNGDCTVYYLCEKQTTSYPTLATFLNGSVPTAADWQELADYAALVGAALDVPQPVGTRVLADPPPATFYHTLTHRGRYLYLNFLLYAPYTCEVDPRWSQVDVYANGTNVCQRVSNGNDEYTVTVDLSTAAPALVIGQRYELKFVVTQNATCQFQGYFNLKTAYEYPHASDGVASWTTFKEWSHAHWVAGNLNPDEAARKITTICANLGALATAISEVAYPSPAFSTWLLYAVRRRRFLHYRSFASTPCKLRWTYRGEEQMADLPCSAPPAWLAADLDSLEGLYPGTPYTVEGVQYAIEDSHV